MAQSNLERQLRAGIRAAQQNNLEQARTLLEGVLRQDRNNELAWVWMASIVPSKREKRVCLERVLQINPENEPAREAINSLVGVVGEGNIDYNAIAAAAKNQLAPVQPAERRATQTAATQGSGLSRTQIRTLLGAAAILLGLLLAASFVLPALGPAAEPTATETPTLVEVTAEVTELVTQGPPTETPLPGIVVTRGTRPPLPTNTPTLTNTPTVTPTPTATLPAIDQYTYLFIGNDGNLYRVDLVDGPRPVAENLIDFDVRSGILALVRPTGAQPLSADPEATAEPEPAAQASSQLFFAPLNDPGAALQVTRLERGAVFSPAVSPDGSQIVYVSNEDGDNELILVDIETGVTRQLTDNTASDIEPHWSPDGSQIVYASDEGSTSRFDLSLVSVTDGSITPLVETSGSSRQPRFSPDGTQIVFISERDRSSNVAVLELGSRQAVRQITFDNAVHASPDWTPDGRYIISISNPGSEDVTLEIISLDGSRQEDIDTGNLEPAVVIVEP